MNATILPAPVRLSKLMAERGMCSRREADDYISRGLVFVDGVKIDVLETRVFSHQSITLADTARHEQQSLITILLNKPIGYVSGLPERGGYKAAVDLITAKNRAREFQGPEFRNENLRGLAPAGRLDIDANGLQVFTQDGRVVKQLTGENSQIEKEYLVRVSGELDESGLALLRFGLSLDDKPLLPARVEWINEDQLRFVVREGRKRQIRRMCDLVGLKGIGLKRVRIGRVRLGNLRNGQWRVLRSDEKF